jgi:hypothetical protein
VDFEQVNKALAGGADPNMLCMTCPWDRNCITPPSMSRAEIDAKMEEARRQDEIKMAAAKSAGQEPGMPVGLLLNALTLSGKDTQAAVCPVFAMRLKLPEGRQIVDGLKQHMQSGNAND